jgi:hypothetical protein
MSIENRNDSTYCVGWDGDLVDLEAGVLKEGDLLVHVVDNLEIFGFFRLIERLQVGWRLVILLSR